MLLNMTAYMSLLVCVHVCRCRSSLDRACFGCGETKVNLNQTEKGGIRNRDANRGQDITGHKEIKAKLQGRLVKLLQVGIAACHSRKRET